MKRMNTNTNNNDNIHGYVVNDPMGLCIAAHGTLAATSSSSSSTTNINNISGIYTNIIHLASQLPFQLNNKSTTTSSNNNTNPSTSLEVTPENDILSNDSNTNNNNITNNNNKSIVVTIEMDDTTIFIKNHDQYTIAIELPNTIPVVIQDEILSNNNNPLVVSTTTSSSTSTTIDHEPITTTSTTATEAILSDELHDTHITDHTMNDLVPPPTTKTVGNSIDSTTDSSITNS